MDNVCKPKKKYESIYLACVFICLVSLFTQESILFGFEILELDFKTSRQVGTLSILSGHFQPRPQGLLAFQYGGGRREDPGTQQKSRD